MKSLETGKDKIQKICDALRKETLEPAKQEAREIIENAHMQAAQIIAEAQKQREALFEEAKDEMDERKRVFQASLNLACRQGIEQLKQTIEKELFNRELDHLVVHEMSDPKVVAQLLNGFLRILEEKGIEEDFVVSVPRNISPRSISEQLLSKVLQRLEKGSLTVGDFAGGVQIQLKGKQITIDISDVVVRELIARYIRRDLRDLVFHV